MNLSKKVFVLLGFFLLVVGISVYLVVKKSSGPKNVNPLSSLERDQFEKIWIDTPSHSLVLKQDPGGWMLDSPVKDHVDEFLIDRLLVTLESFTIESIISSNKEKYSQFELDEDNAKRLRVFRKGKEDPFFDGFFGKRAMGYGTAYFHFNEDVPVRLVDDFPLHYFQRVVNDFRKKRIFPDKIETLEKIKLQVKKGSFVIRRSSATWTREDNNEAMDEKWMTDLENKMKVVRVGKFGADEDKKNDLGFDDPVLVIEAQGPDDKAVLTVGNEVPSEDKDKLKERYAQVGGRDALLIIETQNIDGVLSHIHSQLTP